MKTKIPSEEERINVYRKLLDYFNWHDLEGIHAGGFCRALNKIKYRSRCTSNESYTKKVEDFPELMKFKPIEKCGYHWFDSYNINIRIDILKKILNKIIK